MRLGIQTKFIGILVVAAVLPLLIGVLAVWILGFRHYQRERGRLFQAGAAHLAVDLNQSILFQVEALADWLELARMSRLAADHAANRPLLAGAELERYVTDLDARWPALAIDDPAIQAILTNSLARQLGAFRDVNPVFAEIFVTDVQGQLLASTDKTSDFWQADETWWQQAAGLPAGEVFLQGIYFDESAAVFSVDVAVPLRDPARSDAPVAGVVKGVINLTPLFTSLLPIIAGEAPTRELVLEDGRVLTSLLGREIRAPSRARVPGEFLQVLQHHPRGWRVTSLAGDRPRLIGFAAVEFAPLYPGAAYPTGIAPMHVIVHEDLATVLGPVHRYLRLVALIGVSCVLVFVWAGYYIATRRIIEPVQTLQTAARAVASAAQENSVQQNLDALSRQALRRVQDIRTADEIEALAHDFLTMAGRVLQYHEQLREELTVKTAAIQRDLDIAREFQEALMPRDYPKVPTPVATDPLQLQFQHFYRPASSVGGDFFDVLKMDDHRAGIFIADVMGHGARSALITAILRAFLQELTPKGLDPAAFLAELNVQFSRIISQSSQFIFVSACYLVLDTQRGLATYASAGHPAPLRAGRRPGLVEPLFERLENNPALGLFPTSQYQNFKRTLEPGDLFLLYTDGVTEAQNDRGEEFGLARLIRAVGHDGARGVVGLTSSVLAAVDEFRGDTPLADDICLVACEVQTASPTARLRTRDELPQHKG